MKSLILVALIALTACDKPMTNEEIFAAYRVCNKAGLISVSRNSNDATVAVWCSPGPFRDERQWTQINPNQGDHNEK